MIQKPVLGRVCPMVRNKEVTVVTPCEDDTVKTLFFLRFYYIP
jgi:hypothetical protein